MAQSFDDDLHIVEESDIDPRLLAALAFPDDLNVIQGLDDEPNDVGGLTAAELKAKFDEAGLTIQRYINEKLIPEVVAADATETARNEAEEAREAAEAERIRAETERLDQALKTQIEEETRETQEEARVQAENLRAEAEKGRKAAEAGRRDAEAKRVNETEGVVARAAKEADRAKRDAENADADAVRAGAEADRAEAAAKAAAQARVEAEAVAGGDLSLMLARHNADPEAHGIRRRIIRSRVRDPAKPTYGLEGGEEDSDQVTLRVSAYTGGAEVSAEVNGILYDADNMSANGATAPNGTLIIKKMEEEKNG